MDELRKQLAEKGLSSTGIASGDIYHIPSSALKWTYDPIAPFHFVIVLAAPELLQEPEVLTVTVVPCTSGPIVEDAGVEVPIPNGDGPFKKPTYAVTYLVQPVERTVFDSGPVGTISNSTLSVLRYSTAVSLGIVPAKVAKPLSTHTGTKPGQDTNSE